MTEGTVDKPLLGVRRIIERPRLTRLLDESPARIKMLVAPAGYGKTTLARQWLGTSPHPAAWFVATPSSIDVAALALGLHRAVAVVHPGVGRVLLERLPGHRLSRKPTSKSWRTCLLTILDKCLASNGS